MTLEELKRIEIKDESKSLLSMDEVYERIVNMYKSRDDSCFFHIFSPYEYEIDSEQVKELELNGYKVDKLIFSGSGYRVYGW